ncbi:MAG: agmatinase [Acidobacteria bacterium]|nr:agmatinase [Acidobacteriota bacterium]
MARRPLTRAASKAGSTPSRRRSSGRAPRARAGTAGAARAPKRAAPPPAPLSAGDHDSATDAYFGLTPAESAYATSRVVILPVPFGGTVTYGPGTENGPEAIRVASQQVELFDEETRREPYRLGIHSAPPVIVRGKAPEPMVLEVERRVRRYLRDGKFVVTLGGEHSISPGAVKPYAEAFEGLTVVQFDAHSDLRESYHGTRHNHACAGARMREHARLIQLGIRSQSPEERAVIERGDVETLFAYQMAEGGWSDRILATIPERTPVYVTIDLDYFDPSIMPATGTPEPGGGEWYPTLRFLKGLSARARIVGFDVMELAPVPGLHAPDFLSARLVYKLLAYSLGEPAV